MNYVESSKTTSTKLALWTDSNIQMLLDDNEGFDVKLVLEKIN